MAIKEYKVEIYKDDKKLLEKTVHSFSSDLLRKRLKLEYRDCVFKLEEIKQLKTKRKIRHE